MFPYERSLVNQLAGKPFVLLGVNNDGLETARKGVADHKLNWRNFQDEEGVEGPISKEWAINSFPTVFLIDAKGVIRYRGHMEEELNAQVEKLLSEMGHEVEIETNDQEDNQKESRDNQ